jgi:hypothetical protein
MIARASGVAQAVEHLPSKCDTLSSNPRITKVNYISIKLLLPQTNLTKS